MFAPDSPVFIFIYKLVNIILTGVLCVICCLPVVTFCTSVSAMYYAIVKNIRYERGTLPGCFFHAFRMNLKKGVLLTIILLAVSAVLGEGVYLSTQLVSATGKGSIIPYMTAGMFIPILLILPYLIALLSRFDYKTGEYFRNSLYLCIRHFPHTILFCVLIYGSLILLLSVPRLMFFGFSLPGIICLVVSIQMEVILRKYTSQQDEAKEDQWYLE